MSRGTGVRRSSVLSRPEGIPHAKRASFRLSLRIARRDAAQNRGRSVLIVALIAIPIIGLSALATVESSNVPTAQEIIRDSLGSTQAKLTVLGAPDPTLRQDPMNPLSYTSVPTSVDGGDSTPTPPVAAPAAYLPAGTSILTLRPLSVIAKTRTGIGSLSAIQGEPWNRAFSGRFSILSGRTPANAHEVMVTPAALTRLGASVGASVTLTEPRSGTFRIVGTLRDLTLPSSSQQIFARPAALDGVSTADDLLGTSFYLPDRALSWAAVQGLNRNGIVVLSREVLLDHPSTAGFLDQPSYVFASAQDGLLLFPLVGFSLFEVALLAGAAFMVGTNQQQRSLAILASVGGDRRMLARVVSSAGIVLGLAGGVAGCLVGIGLALAYMVATADGSIARYPGFHVSPVEIPAIILFAMLAGWISALVPARRAARIDVVASLRGAARPPKPSRKAPLVGVVIALLGATITGVASILLVSLEATKSQNPALQKVTVTLIVVGPILLQIAALLLAPLLLRWMSRLLSRVGTAARLAARDTARNASRSVPAVGAIMSTIFIASFLITFLAAAQASQTAEYNYRTAKGVTTVSYDSLIGKAPLTPEQIAQLSTSMESILHTHTVQTLASAVQPEDGAASLTQITALPALNPAAHCTQLGGPHPKSSSILSPTCQGPEYLTQPRDNAHIWVATAAAIQLAIGMSLSQSSLTALNSGKVVAFYPEYVRGGKVTVNWWSGKQLRNSEGNVIHGEPSKSVSLDAVVQKPPHAVNFDMVMSPSTARAAGIAFVTSQLVTRTPTQPTDAQNDALAASGQAIFGRANVAYFNYEAGPPVYAGPAQWALLALCAIIALGAAAIAIGLARSEGRRDERILGSLGSPPRLRRAFSFWSAAIITGVGAIGGVVLGTIPALAVSESLSQTAGLAAVPFDLPWLPLLVAAIGLPLLIAVGSWLTAGRGRVNYNARAPIG